MQSIEDLRPDALNFNRHTERGMELLEKSIKENKFGRSILVDKDGKFHSLCEHHIMPFFGKYVIAYLPNPKGKIIGLSKIARIVDYCAARLQIQERLVADIVAELEKHLGSENPPLGIAVYMQGEHLCKTMRGVKKEGMMSCSHLTGIFRDDASARAEFMSICRRI